MCTAAWVRNWPGSKPWGRSSSPGTPANNAVPGSCPPGDVGGRAPAAGEAGGGKPGLLGEMRGSEKALSRPAASRASSRPGAPADSPASAASTAGGVTTSS